MSTYFGYDVSCTRRLRTGRFVSGVELVAEAYYRRLTTTRGTLIGGEDEQNYGLNLMALVGKPATPSFAASLAGKIENELMKDPRTESVKATVVSVSEGPAVTYTISIEAKTTLGPFTLVLAVSAVSAEILGIQ
jgi:phage baseplate assembly protein W